MKEPNRGACIHAVQLCVERALQNLTAAGMLLKVAGMRDEEAGLLIANAYVHARRAVPEIKNLAIVFPRHGEAKAV